MKSNYYFKPDMIIENVKVGQEKSSNETPNPEVTQQYIPENYY